MGRTSQFEMYRLRAAECSDIAKRVRDRESKRTLLWMANGWLHLAEQADKNYEISPGYETPEPPRHVVQQQQQPQGDNKK
jgi:hypothetical protein